MKKIFLLFTILLSFSAFAQNLTLSEVLAIRKMELGDADEFLTAKGWNFLSAEEFEDSSEAIYTYKKSLYEDIAESFLHYNYSTYNDRITVGIQVNSNTKLNTYVNQIKAWGGKLVKSYIEDGEVIKIYQGSTMTYIISTSSQTNNFDALQTYHFISIITNEDLLNY
ncbi:hypothetical protein [Faecalibacter bovis]|uniref:DUF4358 domain-containing protein n=1 Tax=Faecalibacter bovis TaxID=2898187 RepID=A0ABX7XAH4_9FLAO|nr:hypothetical protein [Faecalibacter bovis]QTV04864.1 hypothetical protein J9309_08640 [Faecalibacter bovis]